MRLVLRPLLHGLTIERVGDTYRIDQKHPLVPEFGVHTKLYVTILTGLIESDATVGVHQLTVEPNL